MRPFSSAPTIRRACTTPVTAFGAVTTAATHGNPSQGDLARGQNRLQTPIMGRTWGVDAAWDLYAMSFYGSVTSLSESPIVEGLLYAGTDDGLIQVSEDQGG